MVHSKIFENVDCVETIDSVQKSPKSDPPSRFIHVCEFQFDRFDIPFDSIDIASEGHGGPPTYAQFRGVMSNLAGGGVGGGCLVEIVGVLSDGGIAVSGVGTFVLGQETIISSS